MISTSMSHALVKLEVESVFVSRDGFRIHTSAVRRRGVDFPRYLLRLTELELLDPERRATERRIRQAKFDVVKSLDTFEF